jgi:hypothetical protein
MYGFVGGFDLWEHEFALHILIWEIVYPEG